MKLKYSATILVLYSLLCVMFISYNVMCIFRTIYEKLSEAVADEARDLYQQRCSEISPNIRYCEYNIGDESAAQDLMEMRRQIGREDPLTSRLDVCLQSHHVSIN